MDNSKFRVRECPTASCILHCISCIPLMTETAQNCFSLRPMFRLTKRISITALLISNFRYYLAFNSAPLVPRRCYPVSVSFIYKNGNYNISDLPADLPADLNGSPMAVIYQGVPSACFLSSQAISNDSISSSPTKQLAFITSPWTTCPTPLGVPATRSVKTTLGHTEDNIARLQSHYVSNSIEQLWNFKQHQICIVVLNHISIDL
jgi:hypothetical protein